MYKETLLNCGCLLGKGDEKAESISNCGIFVKKNMYILSKLRLLVTVYTQGWLKNIKSVKKWINMEIMCENIWNKCN